MIYKYCRRCGRRLQGAENRARGYGKICYQKVQVEAHVAPLVPYQLTLFSIIDQNKKGT